MLGLSDSSREVQLSCDGVIRLAPGLIVKGVLWAWPRCDWLRAKMRDSIVMGSQVDFVVLFSL